MMALKRRKRIDNSRCFAYTKHETHSHVLIHRKEDNHENEEPELQFDNNSQSQRRDCPPEGEMHVKLFSHASDEPAASAAGSCPFTG